MKQFQKTIFLAIMIGSFKIFSLEAVLASSRENQIGDDNAKLHKNYEYYEDYLNDQQTRKPPVTDNAYDRTPTRRDHIAEVLDTKPLEDGPGRYQGKDINKKIPE